MGPVLDDRVNLARAHDCIAELERECDAAQAKLAELRRLHDTDAVTCKAALDRVDELTAERDRALAEVERLRVEVDDQRAREHRRDVVCDERYARLEAEVEQTERGYQHTRVRLAAANALIERSLDEIIQRRGPRDTRPCQETGVHRDEDGPRCRRLPGSADPHRAQVHRHCRGLVPDSR